MIYLEGVYGVLLVAKGLTKEGMSYLEVDIRDWSFPSQWEALCQYFKAQCFQIFTTLKRSMDIFQTHLGATRENIC